MVLNSNTLWLRVASAATFGLGGWVAGRSYEKLKQSPPLVLTKGTVLAAIPTTLPSVAVPTETFVKENRTSEIMKFGFPGFDQLRALDDYILSYDRRNRTAHWVYEHLTYEGLKNKDNVDRAKCAFQEDTSIHPFFRSSNNDYLGSGFDRGHLAAAGNHRKAQTHCDQTFLLSNMAPQVGKGFNRHAWNKLEKYVRYLTRHYKNVYVCTGPLYLPRKEADGKTYIKYQVIGPNNVAVPTHFFKVIVAETAKQELEMEAYVMPNAVIAEGTSIFAFQVPVESIERAAGLLLFDKIPRNNLKRIDGHKKTFV